MKYIRTKDRIREIIEDFGGSCNVKSTYSKGRPSIDNFTVVNGVRFAPRADTIEELCDAFVMFSKNRKKGISVLQSISYARLYVKRDNRYNGHYVEKIYGAIWTEWGLKYVAKMNEKGELELL